MEGCAGPSGLKKSALTQGEIPIAALSREYEVLLAVFQYLLKGSFFDL